jgi:hypothetical protein
MIFFAVFAVSLTSLCYEVLLTRFFSFSQWNHLSFMVISIVLFGFGLSGSLLSLAESRRPGWTRSLLGSGRLPALIALCSLSMSGSFLLIKNIPLDYFRMPLEWVQAGYLLATFCILLLPFFFAGGVISLAFAGLPGRSGWIYFASMLGSAVGALLPAALLPVLGEGGTIFCCALGLLAFPIAGSLFRLSRSPRPAVLLSSLALFVVTGAFLLYRGGALLEIRPSPYKLLSQVLQFPDTRVTAGKNTLRARFDRLESPYIRFAPGLSLKYAGSLPERTFLVQDGDTLFVLYRLDDPEQLAFSRYTHSFAGYLVRDEGGLADALILQQGGGLSLPCAASAGVGEITVLLDHREAAELYESRYASDSIRVKAGNLRKLLCRDGGRYDRIHLESWGPSIPGVASLNQEHLLTVEAFKSYIDHLRPGGVFILSRKLLLPPSDLLRLFATAYTAVKDRGVERPGEHIVVIRGWDSYTLLLSPSPFRQPELESIREFCRQRNFDPVFYDGIEEREVNRFNRFQEPYHYREIQALYRALERGEAEQYFRGYYLDIAPATDDRPFHSRFTRWLEIGDLYRTTGSRLYSLLLSGETVVLAVLAIALLLGVLFLLLPRLLSGSPAARRKRRAAGTSNLPALLYFLATGAGFMFLEMGFLQHYTFLFGNPVLAFAVVLATLLVVSGVGGAVSAGWNLRSLHYALVLLIACLGLLFFIARPLGYVLLGRTPGIQAVGAVVLLAPAAFLAGIPFPTGLRLLADDPGSRAFGWAANGIASVVASILALPLAMTWGISRLLPAAAFCYVVVIGASWWQRHNPAPTDRARARALFQAEQGEQAG